MYRTNPTIKLDLSPEEFRELCIALHLHRRKYIDQAFKSDYELITANMDLAERVVNILDQIDGHEIFDDEIVKARSMARNK